MPAQITGTTGIDQVQNNVVTTAKVADGAITPVKTQPGALPSMVRLNTANGYGSTNTVIRRFTTVVTNQGSDITYVDSAGNGASFTINTNGVYAINYNDNFTSGGQAIGVSLNSSQLTTSISSITTNDILCQGMNSTANSTAPCSWVGYLVAGSVIRPHTSGNGTGALTSAVQFTIQRVA